MRVKDPPFALSRRLQHPRPEGALSFLDLFIELRSFAAFYGQQTLLWTRLGLYVFDLISIH
jgi:hypothetical protein